MGLSASGSGHALKPWQILLLVKIMEFMVQMRPRALARLLAYSDRAQRRAYRWCVRNAAGVWFDEIHDFLFRSNTHRLRSVSLRDFWGEPIAQEAPLSPRGAEPTPFHRTRMAALDSTRPTGAQAMAQ